MPKKITIRGVIGFSEYATPRFLDEALKEAKGEDVEIMFSSPGGLVFAGIEMANMIRNYPGNTVAKLTGLAASMSSYIPMMADKVVAEDNAVFMIHNVFGGGFGDFRDMAKIANRLEGLRDLLAKAYVSKTKKPMSEIQKLMNEETFFFGDKIAQNGFADEIIEAEGKKDDDDKDSAIIKAQAEIENCKATLRENEQQVADDFQQVAAFLGGKNKEGIRFEPEGSVDDIKPSAKAEKTKEVQMKTLKEFLDANPEAKAEFDEAIKKASDDARADGIATGKQDMKNMITSVSPYLNSKDYPTVIGETALKVLTGESSMVELKASVAAVDAVNEKSKEEKAKGEQEKKETPPESPEGLTEDGTVKDASQVDGAIASFNSEFGTGKKGGTE